MDKGLEFFRFGLMGIIGVFGMLFLPEDYFNLSALVFIVSVGIFFIVMLIPSHSSFHVARRL